MTETILLAVAGGLIGFALARRGWPLWKILGVAFVVFAAVKAGPPLAAYLIN